MNTVWKPGLLFSLALLSTSCFQSPTDPPDNDANPLRIQIVSGNNQQGSTSEYLPQPLVFRVTNQSDSPMANCSVTISVIAGSGVVEEAELLPRPDEETIWSVGACGGGWRVGWVATAGVLPVRD
jgi:hypothetical protein